MISVLITNFNNEAWIEKSLKSLLSQSHRDWQCFLVDDVSTDGSPDIIQGLIAGDSRFAFIKNQIKRYQVGNYCRLMSQIDNADICLTLDGDDWLADEHVFDRVVDAYKDDTWLAWGGMESISGQRTYNPTVADVCYSWHIPFHLRTWRGFLWKQIDDSKLRDDHGEYFRVAGDLAFMIEMANMAGTAHCKTFSELSYFYNDENHLCNHTLKGPEQLANDALIRGRRKRRIYL